MKEFHIITVGNSLIANFQKFTENKEIKEAKMGDEEFWGKKLEDRKFLEEMYGFLKESPTERSAEANSLNAYMRKYNVPKEEIEIYLSGTKTSSNEIALETINRYLREVGFSVLVPKQVEGYFPKAEFDERIAVEEFEKDLSSLLNSFVYLAKRRREEGYKVLFNPTGGFKAHVAICAFAGFITESLVYYIHEEFKEVIVFPPLFYLPQKREMELLEKLRDKVPRSGSGYTEIVNEFPVEVERLIEYGLVKETEDEFGKPFRIQITDRGVWAYDYLKERK
jgi:putative CRISPR-associated protein (TIGR02619 family)